MLKDENVDGRRSNEFLGNFFSENKKLREYFTWFVLVIAGLEGRLRINCPSAFLKISKITMEIYPKKSSEPKMWLLVNPF